MVNCPKCGSDDVDHATIGIAGAVQCVDCGHVFAYTEWPFPTSLVNKPLNDNLPKRYNPSNDEESPI
jgi:ribosomal protein L37AE/L43A